MLTYAGGEDVRPGDVVRRSNDDPAGWPVEGVVRDVRRCSVRGRDRGRAGAAPAACVGVWWTRGRGSTLRPEKLVLLARGGWRTEE